MTQTLRYLLALLALTAFTVAQADVTRGTVLERSYDFAEAGEPEMEYALYVPTGYRENQPAPLIILLHGLGSNPQQVIGYQGIIDNAEEHGYIVAAPYGYNERGWYGSRGPGRVERPGQQNDAASDDPENLGELSEQDVLNVLDLVREEFSVDERRVYLMGHSMGGGGTLYLGMKYPDLWAGLAPMAPAIWSEPDELAQIRGMPIIMVQGEDDRLVRVERVRPWAEKMEELDMSHRYIEIPDGDHVRSISRNPEMIGEVFGFLNEHSRP